MSSQLFIEGRDGGGDDGMGERVRGGEETSTLLYLHYYCFPVFPQALQRIRLWLKLSAEEEAGDETARDRSDRWC